jgi:hypothetical protein
LSTAIYEIYQLFLSAFKALVCAFEHRQFVGYGIGYAGIITPLVGAHIVFNWLFSSNPALL